MSLKNKKILLRILYVFLALSTSAFAVYHIGTSVSLAFDPHPTASEKAADRVREAVLLALTFIVIPLLIIRSEVINCKQKQLTDRLINTQTQNSQSISGTRLTFISILAILASPIIVYAFTMALMVVYFVLLRT